jgi:hypothetical protein
MTDAPRAALAALLKEGRELTLRNLRKMSQRDALYEWGDRVQVALDAMRAEERVAPPSTRCLICGGMGWYPEGDTAAPEQVQC